MYHYQKLQAKNARPGSDAELAGEEGYGSEEELASSEFFATHQVGETALYSIEPIGLSFGEVAELSVAVKDALNLGHNAGVIQYPLVTELLPSWQALIGVLVQDERRSAAAGVIQKLLSGAQRSAIAALHAIDVAGGRARKFDIQHLQLAALRDSGAYYDATRLDDIAKKSSRAIEWEHASHDRLKFAGACYIIALVLGRNYGAQLPRMNGPIGWLELGIEFATNQFRRECLRALPAGAKLDPSAQRALRARVEAYEDTLRGEIERVAKGGVHPPKEAEPEPVYVEPITPESPPPAAEVCDGNWVGKNGNGIVVARANNRLTLLGRIREEAAAMMAEDVNAVYLRIAGPTNSKGEEKLHALVLGKKKKRSFVIKDEGAPAPLTETIITPVTTPATVVTTPPAFKLKRGKVLVSQSVFADDLITEALTDAANQWNAPSDDVILSHRKPEMMNYSTGNTLVIRCTTGADLIYTISPIAQ